ncbi:MAG: cytochrome ubiquinol oxidase subunit I [Gemmatimonadales bacterium]
MVGLPFPQRFAFFTEATFSSASTSTAGTGSGPAPTVAGILVAVSGGISGIFVVLVNAFMNAPIGFELVNGQITSIDLIKAMQSPGGFPAGAAHDPRRLRRDASRPAVAGSTRSCCSASR